MDELSRASITSLVFSLMAYGVLLSGELAKFISLKIIKIKSAQRENSVGHQKDSPKNYEVKLSLTIVSSIIITNVKFANKVEAKIKINKVHEFSP